MTSLTAAPSLDATVNTKIGQRLYFLDWLRILAFALLLPYHVGMYYVSWYWHVKSPFASTLLEPFMRLSSPWRMSVLFLVSGAATAFMLNKQGASRALLRQRAVRLLVPLLFGILVIVPPQSYFEVVQRLHFRGDYFDFMALYLRGYGGFCGANKHCLILPTWNHLWFLPYLFSYTALLWLMIRVHQTTFGRASDYLAGSLRGAGLLLLPIGYLACTRLALQSRFPITNALFGDWFAHSQYLALFLLGVVLARTPRLWPRFEQLRWLAIALALLAWTYLVGRSGNVTQSGNITPWDSALRAIIYSIQQWCAIVAALGYAHRHLNRDSAARVYLTQAVFPIYILHQTVIILLAISLAPLALTPAIEAPLLIGATLVIALLGFELIRRSTWLRPLFGLARSGDLGSAQSDLGKIWFALGHKRRERLARRGA